MKRTTTLLLMAATLAPLPLYADQAPAAAQSFAALAAANTAPAADVQQLAAQFAPAALLPANTELALVLPHVTEHIMAYCPDDSLADAPIDSIALGLADGTGKSLAALQAFHSLMMLPGAAEDTAMEWKKDAKDTLSELITQAASRIGQESRSQAGGELAQVVIHPIYLIASPKKGEEDTLKSLATMCTAALAEQSGEMPGVEPIQAKDMQGVKISGKALAELIESQEADGDDKPNDELLQLQAELAKRTFYLLGGMRGDNAVIVLCENPEEIQWAPSAAQSVLSTEAWKTVSASQTGGDIALAATVAPKLCATRHACAPVTGVLQQLAELFKTMAGKESANAAAFQAAASGLNTIAGEAVALQTDLTKASTVLLWETPGHVHLSLSGDAQGLSYKPGQLRLTAMADNPRNVLYLESTELSWSKKPDILQLLQAATDALDGGIATLRPEKQSEVSEYMQLLKAYLPELQEARQAILTLREGLNNTDAFVVDETTQTLPFLNNEKADLPRIAYYSGVADRAKLTAAWDGLIATAGKALTKSGSDPMLLGALPIAAAPAGKTVSYSLALPFLTPDMGGNVTVSDTAFTIGTSSVLNAEIVKSATGNMDFAGAVFSLNFAQLAKVARAASNLAKAGDDAEAALLGDDDDDAAESAETVADGLEAAAAMFERMMGTSTVKDGVHTLHLDLKKR